MKTIAESYGQAFRPSHQPCSDHHIDHVKTDTAQETKPCYIGGILFKRVSVRQVNANLRKLHKLRNHIFI